MEVTFVAILGIAQHPTDGLVQVLIPNGGKHSCNLHNIFPRVFSSVRPNTGESSAQGAAATATSGNKNIPHLAALGADLSRPKMHTAGNRSIQPPPATGPDQKHTAAQVKVTFVATLGIAQHPDHGCVQVLIPKDGEDYYILQNIFGRVYKGLSAIEGSPSGGGPYGDDDSKPKEDKEKEKDEGSDYQGNTNIKEPPATGPKPLRRQRTPGVGHTHVKRVLSSDATEHGSTKRVKMPDILIK